MTPRRVYLDYLEDIADAADKMAQFIAGMSYAQFAQDTKTSYAVIRALHSRLFWRELESRVEDRA